MKIKVLRLVVIMACLLIGSFSISAQVKVVSHGIWSFNAPTAPDGYTYGIIEIKKDSVNTSFTESKYKFPSIWIKVKNDSIIYNAIIDDTDVLFSLKVENETSIKGNAVWDDGETQMILKKKID